MRLLAPVLGVALLAFPSALIGQADTTAEVEEAIMAWQTAMSTASWPSRSGGGPL